jgi:uncharacterized iron-regulated protein
MATGPVDGILDARTGMVVSFEDMVEDLGTVRMVYVGESHTNPEHHEIQRRVIDAISARNPRVMVGMEMLQRPYQEVLDRWSAGGMDEGAFLREVHWYEQWSDWNLYAPILQLARDRRLRVLGLQLPGLEPGGAVSREIAKSGIENLPPWMRAQLPEVIDTSVKAHQKSIRAIFFSHPGTDKATAEEAFRRFYEAQCTWDETMAESAVRALEGTPADSAIVVLAGAMHVRDFHAIPERARRRNGLEYRVVLPMDRDDFPEGGFPTGMGRPADYVLYTEPTPPSSDGRLGVVLRGGDATVTKVAAGGTAATAGLQEGDVLLSLNDRPIADTVDLRLALEGMSRGSTARLRWKRGDAVQEGSAPLTAPPPMAMPPAPKPEKPAEAPPAK